MSEHSRYVVTDVESMTIHSFIHTSLTHSLPLDTACLQCRALLVMFGSPISCMEDMAVVLRSKLLSVDIESRDLLLNELCDVPGDVSTSRASGIAGTSFYCTTVVYCVLEIDEL